MIGQMTGDIVHALLLDAVVPKFVSTGIWVAAAAVAAGSVQKIANTFAPSAAEITEDATFTVLQTSTAPWGEISQWIKAKAKEREKARAKEERAKEAKTISRWTLSADGVRGRDWRSSEVAG